MIFYVFFCNFGSFLVIIYTFMLYSRQFPLYYFTHYSLPCLSVEVNHFEVTKCWLNSTNAIFALVLCRSNSPSLKQSNSVICGTNYYFAFIFHLLSIFAAKVQQKLHLCKFLSTKKKEIEFYSILKASIYT